MDYAQKALEMHRQWKGKIRVNTPCVLENKEDLSVAYTPGVAAPCLEIQKDVDKSYEYTRRGNLWPLSPTAPPCWAWGTSAPRPGCR